MKIPCLSIRPGYIACYNTYTETHYNRPLRMSWLDNFKANDHKGKVSRNAEKRIKNAIDWLLALASDKQFTRFKDGRSYWFKINFVTLTLSSPQMHSDNTIKKELLNQLLVEARKKWNIIHYLWRAERQKNGNIHFHLVCDKFIPWSELRDTWNRIQNKLGYVDRFHDKHKKRNPNSTDVHSIKNIKNISAYLSKYCSKQSEGEPIKGKLWGLSESLSKIKAATDLIYGKIKDELEEIEYQFLDRVKTLEHCKIIYVNVKEWVKFSAGALSSLYYNYLNEFRARYSSA